MTAPADEEDVHERRRSRGAVEPLPQRVHGRVSRAKDLVYAPGETGQEPIPVLTPTDARFYASWLRLHGSMTRAEWRWLWEDIAHHEAGSGDDAQC